VCGDGPGDAIAYDRVGQGSPRVRGWTEQGRKWRMRRHGFPTCAGMDRSRAGRACSGARVPHVCGDGPRTRWPRRMSLMDSPRVRGLGLRPASGVGLQNSRTGARSARLSRTAQPVPACTGIMFAARFRAWACGTRACTLVPRGRALRLGLSPACAGIGFASRFGCGLAELARLRSFCEAEPDGSACPPRVGGSCLRPASGRGLAELVLAHSFREAEPYGSACPPLVR